MADEAVAEVLAPVLADASASAPEVVTEPAPLLSTPQAAPVETPVATPPVSEPVLPVPPSSDIQEYITLLEQQKQTAQEQADLQTLGQVTSQYAQQLEQQYGLAPEQAQRIARQHGDIAYKQYNSERLLRAQFRAAISYGAKHGVDPMQLLDSPNESAMRKTAETLSAGIKQAQENAQLKARIAALERGRVPAQSFSQGAQPGAGAGLTGDALEAAWIKHEIEHPDETNPLDSAYRTMLRR